MVVFNLGFVSDSPLIYLPQCLSSPVHPLNDQQRYLPERQWDGVTPWLETFCSFRDGIQVPYPDNRDFPNPLQPALVPYSCWLSHLVLLPVPADARESCALGLCLQFSLCLERPSYTFPPAKLL